MAPGLGTWPSASLTSQSCLGPLGMSLTNLACRRYSGALGPSRSVAPKGSLMLGN